MDGYCATTEYILLPAEEEEEGLARLLRYLPVTKDCVNAFSDILIQYRKIVCPKNLSRFYPPQLRKPTITTSVVVEALRGGAQRKTDKIRLNLMLYKLVKSNVS